MGDTRFVVEWKKLRPLFVVPQACVMGFKTEIMTDFFALWKKV
jgi:hypothetical protein